MEVEYQTVDKNTLYVNNLYEKLPTDGKDCRCSNIFLSQSLIPMAPTLSPFCCRHQEIHALHV